MRAFIILCLVAPVTVILAAPAVRVPGQDLGDVEYRHVSVVEMVNTQNQKADVAVTVTVTVTASPAASTGGAKTGEAGKGKEEEAKTRSNGTLAQAVALRGGNELQAVSFFGSTGTGAIEIEYQNIDGRTLIVTENKTPASAPAGFKFVDTSSYIVALVEGASNITRQQIDYVFTLNSAAVTAVNISAVKTGKLCVEAKTFVISDALGEQDFEADEGESVIKVDSMIGEWGVFVPV
ncbi:hypothetical protein VTL71DRAFT_9986 [Oculimacula yallundae]|uniref:Uncharacterized protein n=1 Tax=Oculimacula yallundae TaxID=86028 RepID=A0ABR4BPY7_9HELO